MSIAWGAYNGHLRVGIDYSISPSSPSHSDTSVKVTWKFYVGTDGWNFSGDVSYLHEGATGWGGTTTTFTNNLSSGSMLVDTVTRTYSISYNSGSVSANANLTGAYNGATPSASRTINLPDRPKATPSAPGAPTFSSINAGGATANWSGSSDNGGASIDEYGLVLSKSSSFPTPYDWDDGGKSSSSIPPEAITGLEPNTKYYGRVHAHNSVGWGPWSATGSFTTGAASPGTPTNVTITGKTQTTMDVGWSASAQNGGGAVTYTVDCATDSAFTSIVSTQTGVTATTASFSGLTASTIYYFRVKAVNSLGTSAESATASASTLGVTTYTDTGDYVTLVNNLASAVAGKLVHLGMFTEWHRVASLTVANAVNTAINMDTQGSVVGPDAPTHTGSGYNEFTIQYPGLYYIEFGMHYDESKSYERLQGIAVNGVWGPNHGTINEYLGSTAVGTSAGSRTVRTVVRLNAGDTVGFNVYQASGGSMTASTSDYYAWAKLAMVGF